MSDAPIDIVLFDLGGVLIDFGGVGPMKLLAGIETDDELWRRWLTCRWVRSFERGECSPDEFAQGVVDDWGLDMEPDAYLAEFEGWPFRVFDGAEALVAGARERVPVGCLSNTNVLHWDRTFTQYPILDAFDFRFLSFEMGIVKPDRELFDRVAEVLPVPAERVLFLDDNILNVEGATQAGFAARHTRGVDEARAALVEAGILRESR
ncbi:MAG TPA: HAD-IA family hydrolase [Acidimicrobiia bacterium]|nr:HAD-IA family hydrolase [Acidimicrobiia bacterium]